MHHSVHPHIRGAYVILLNRSSPKPGSSPHTWGIQELGGADQDRLRFIPTYVGHTMLGQIVNHILTVHPHIRGAYSLLRCHSSGGFGSSPHTWGILSGDGVRHVPRRFIPTYVGHTGVADTPKPTPTVHPHIRGAYSGVVREAFGCRGSSPHTWGIPGAGSGQGGRTRFIATYVGHTDLSLHGQIPRPVHPHIRGAYGHLDGKLPSVFGSSPHTWGIRKRLSRKPA